MKISRMKVLARVGKPGADDVPVMRAIRLLAQLEPDATPPIIDCIRLLPLQGRDGCCIAGVIFISPTSTVYQAARNGGDVKGLAMLLHKSREDTRQ